MSETNKIKVCWISAGVSSFVAGYLERETIDEYIYIDIADQHYDSMRYVLDCEKFLGKKIQILQPDFVCVEDVIRATGIIKHPGTHFAPCTNYLKKLIRKQWEKEHADYEITYVWGYDFDEQHRAKILDESTIWHTNQYPLIERMLTKQDAHAIADRLGVKRPYMYEMGYQNNNCIGCIKGGMGYWNKIRVDFPDVFVRRAKLERDIGASILKESDGTPLYLDELEPNRGRIEDEISIDCGVMCFLNIEGEHL